MRNKEFFEIIRAWEKLEEEAKEEYIREYWLKHSSVRRKYSRRLARKLREEGAKVTAKEIEDLVQKYLNSR